MLHIRISFSSMYVRNYAENNLKHWSVLLIHAPFSMALAQGILRDNLRGGGGERDVVCPGKAERRGGGRKKEAGREEGRKREGRGRCLGAQK